MRVARFAAIFNVDAEQAGSALTPSVRTSPIANASEYDLISGRFARQWANAAITANSIHCLHPFVLTGRWI
jgi:hypothetical protein